MGLDVTAYSKVKRLESFTADEWGEPIGIDAVCITLADFRERAGSIIDGYYTFDDSHGFRAGSYSGYNNWREQLSELAGYPLEEYVFNGQKRTAYSAGAWNSAGGAFWELINFSDCEGVLGSEVCKKLLADFIAFDTIAQTKDESFYSKYQDWTKGMKLAANDGLFDFH